MIFSILVALFVFVVIYFFFEGVYYLICIPYKLIRKAAYKKTQAKNVFTIISIVFGGLAAVPAFFLCNIVPIIIVSGVS